MHRDGLLIGALEILLLTYYLSSTVAGGGAPRLVHDGKCARYTRH